VAYTSPYLDEASNNPDYKAEVLTHSNVQTLAEIHEERRRIENGMFRQPAGRSSTRSADRVSAMPATQTNVDSQRTSGPFADSPSYYESRSGSAQPRSAYQAPPPSQARTQKYEPAFRQLAVVRPQNYSEAEQVAKALKDGSAVVLDITQVRAELGKRILDFSFGVAAALEAQVESPANRIYAFTKGNGLSKEERELLVARGVL